jgi:hypothetical protein
MYSAYNLTPGLTTLGSTESRSRIGNFFTPTRTPLTAELVHSGVAQTATAILHTAVGNNDANNGIHDQVGQLPPLFEATNSTSD